MKKFNSLLIARYLLFGFFVICNAIICSVAVWNYSLIRASPTSQVDVYLIFLGAFSLASIFTLIFVELLCTDPFTTRVWFECGWTTVFWIMNLAGAAALTAIEPDLKCSHQAIAFVDSLCTSARVLLAFTWVSTIILLLYLLLLIFTAVTHQRDDPGVWNSSVRSLRLVTARQCLSSAPSSPSAPRFKKRAPMEVYTPHPVRSAPVPAYLHRAGLGSEYEIEYFNPTFSATEQMDTEVFSSLPEAIPLPPAPVMLHSKTLLYGQRGTTQQLPSSIVYLNQPQPQPPAPPTQSTSLPSPSPLGEWPRRDVMEQPVKPKRKLPPTSFEFPRRNTIPSTEPLSTSSSPPSQPRTRRPSGPRMRVPSGDNTQRPAPLDLSGISNHEIGHVPLQRDHVY
ncbi:hypothetical protein BDN67DRAFT_1008093 [Paxillus ammoniavirescens]|nr:hypothetical protein BDN67DRAFT_1008093 [Paxillus ammoniavirescens]